jgi:hypothetical protein
VRSPRIQCRRAYLQPVGSMRGQRPAQPPAACQPIRPAASSPPRSRLAAPRRVRLCEKLQNSPIASPGRSLGASGCGAARRGLMAGSSSWQDAGNRRRGLRYSPPPDARTRRTGRHRRTSPSLRGLDRRAQRGCHPNQSPRYPDRAGPSYGPPIRPPRGRSGPGGREGRCRSARTHRSDSCLIVVGLALTHFGVLILEVSGPAGLAV